MAREHLTILDLSDREFLLIVRDVSDGDGWADAIDVADQLDLTDKRSASSRLSWMKRYGAVEREYERDEHGQLRTSRDGTPKHTQRWRLTELGLAMATGKLNKTTQATLERMDSGALLMTARFLSGRAAADTSAGKLVMREWRHGVGRY